MLQKILGDLSPRTTNTILKLAFMAMATKVLVKVFSD